MTCSRTITSPCEYDARLFLLNPAEGVQLTVIPESLDMEHAEYHALLLQGLGVAEDVPTRTEKRGGTKLLVSAFPLTIDNMEFSFRLATAVQGERHVQLLVSSLRSNEQYLNQRFTEIISRFELHPTPPTMIENQGATTVDHRLGFQVTSPRSWKLANATPQQIRSIGTMFTMTQKKAACIIIAICSPMGFDEEMAVDSLIQNSHINVDPGSRSESDSTLAGIPARQVVMSGTQKGEKAFVKMWMARRAHTMYLVLITGKHGSREHHQSDSFRNCLSLIE
jgi:hypothetical protein